MMLGYHASHEQFPPEELLDFVAAAQRYHPAVLAQAAGTLAWLALGSGEA